MSLRRSIVAGLALALLLAPAGSRGQNLEISPVVLEISSRSPSAIVTVKNLGAQPMRYQVKPFRWSEDRAGEMALAPATDLAVYPTLFQLEPGGARKVRVGSTAPPGDVEAAWRIVVEELPDATAGGGRKVVIRTRFSVPVFQAPRRPSPAVDFGLKVEGKGLVVVAYNRGNVRSRPTAMAVELLDERDAELDRLEVAPWYVLPGAERAFPAPAPAERCGQVRRGRLLVDQKVQAVADFPTGVCGT